MERAGATTMKGNPLTLIGPQLQVGDHAPDFSVVDGTLSPVNLEKRSVWIPVLAPRSQTTSPAATIRQYSDWASASHRPRMGAQPDCSLTTYVQPFKGPRRILALEPSG